MQRPFYRATFIVCLLASLGGCGDAPVTPPLPGKLVRSASLSPSTDTLELDDRVQLLLTVRDSSGALVPGARVTWQSSDTSIVAASYIGLLTAKKEGAATVTATVEEDVTATATITVVPPIKFTAIDAGDSFTCGISTDAKTYCWGTFVDPSFASNKSGPGRLPAPSRRPVAIKDAPALVQITAGGAHACGLTAAGDAYCWGRGVEGELGDANRNSWPSAVKATGAPALTAIVAGADHTCGLASGGKVWCWGSYQFEAAGPQSPYTAPVQLFDMGIFTRLDAGERHTCGLVGTTVLCWGTNTTGAIGNYISLGESVEQPNVIASSQAPASSIATGANHSCRISATGQIFCFGANTDGQLGRSTTSSANAASPLLANSFTATGATLALGGSHSCILNANGNKVVQCWGKNHLGQRGDESPGSSGQPSVVIAPVQFRAITAGRDHTCGLALDSTVWCWGDNAYGQLGNVDVLVSSWAPVRVRLP